MWFKKILLAGINRTLNEWLCDSFAELIEEMELWKWNDATGDFWSRLAKALQQSNISHQEITQVYICRLKYNIISYSPLNDIIMLLCHFQISLCRLSSYPT